MENFDRHNTQQFQDQSYRQQVNAVTQDEELNYQEQPTDKDLENDIQTHKRSYKKQCNCTKSQCMKGYCSCFANKQLCTSQCGCKDCLNKVEVSYQPKTRLGRIPFGNNSLNQQQQFHKNEEIALKLRSSKRQQIIDKKRQTFQLQKKTKGISLLYTNIRGVNSHIKQQQLNMFLKQQTIFDIIALSETKLTSKLTISGYKSVQTPFNRYSGVWQGIKYGWKHKVFKTLKENISWMSITHLETPIHIITCYIPPYKNQETREIVQRFKFLIHSIYDKFRASRLIIQGDFNHELDSITDFLKQFSLQKLIDEPTHNYGNQLDQVFTNLKLVKIDTQDLDFTDHKAIKINLDFIQSENDLKLDQIPIRERISDIRKIATDDVTATLLKSDKCFQQSLKQTISSRIKKRKTIDYWYQNPPRWILDRNATEDTIKKYFKDKEWMQTQLEIQESYYNNNLKRFFQLIRKISKVQKTKSPIDGLKVGDEVIYDQERMSAIVQEYYQTGFVKGKSTHDNLHNILTDIKQNRRKKIGLTYLFIDLKGAYDSVSQSKLAEILQKKCNTQEEQHLVKLICGLVDKNKINYNGKLIQQEKGVVQGGILSPFLFNLYLDNFLQSSDLFHKMIQNQQILAFADDIIIKVKEKQEIENVIKEFERLKNEYGLILNKQKSVFMSNNKKFESVDEILGVKKVQCAKYLGINLHFKQRDIVDNIKDKMMQQMMAFKGRIYQQQTQVKNTIYMTFIRNLIIYYCTPLVSTNIIKLEEVRKMEHKMKRSIFSLPNDIKAKVIMNLTTVEEQEAVEVIKRLSSRLRYSQITECPADYQQKRNCTVKKPTRVYIQKDLMNLMFAVTAGRTVTGYNQTHYCRDHKVIVDKKHILHCEHLHGMGSIFQYNKRLEQQRLNEMTFEEVRRIKIFFGWLRVRIDKLEEAGIYHVIKKNFRIQYIPKQSVTISV